MPNLRADLLVELAEILRASGDATGATRSIGEAIDLYERKGNLVGAARARGAHEGALPGPEVTGAVPHNGRLDLRTTDPDREGALRP